MKADEHVRVSYVVRSSGSVAEQQCTTWSDTEMSWSISRVKESRLSKVW